VSPRARDDGSAPISVELSTPAPDDASAAAESDGSEARCGLYGLGYSLGADAARIADLPRRDEPSTGSSSDASTSSRGDGSKD
jgi:hypothetical protein